MSRRDWIERRIADIERRLADVLVPAGFIDHRNERVRDELRRLLRERDEMDCE